MRTYTHIPIVPVKRRARFTRNGRAYVDAKTKAELQIIRDSYTGELLEGPLALFVGVYKPAPKGIRKVVPFTVKPDIDNVLKCVMDGLNGVAYKDDSQVVLVTIVKYDRQPGIQEGTVYEIHEIGGMDAPEHLPSGD